MTALPFQSSLHFNHPCSVQQDDQTFKRYVRSISANLCSRLALEPDMRFSLPYILFNLSPPSDNGKFSLAVKIVSVGQSTNSSLFQRLPFIPIHELWLTSSKVTSFWNQTPWTFSYFLLGRCKCSARCRHLHHGFPMIHITVVVVDILPFYSVP